MKTKTKARRAPKRRAQRNYNEENIFNPFAPLMSAMRERSNRVKPESGGTFRNAFITVLLIHLIAVMGFAAYSAVNKATKAKPVAKVFPKSKQDSRVAEILNRPSATMLASAEAEPGHKLEPLRNKDSEPTKAVKSENAAPRSVSMTGKEDDLPPVMPGLAAKTVDSTQAKSESAAHQEPAKQAFLAATGRLAQSDEQVIPTPEIRRADPVSKPIEPATAPAEPPMPPPSQYTVQAGDNIFTISRRMNVSFTELAEANNLSSPRDVRVGQVLVSPSARRDAM
jgi:LysM repeat protein